MSEQSAVRMVLVHGICHGAWSWYKVVAELRSMGYSVTAIDLAASGIDPRRIPEDVSTFAEYSQPLMDLVAAAPHGKRLVLVGHSLGGLSLALAMDAFPDKVAAAVFVTALLPDTNHDPSFVLAKIQRASSDTKMDLEFTRLSVPGRPQQLTSVCFNPKNLERLYQNCSFEDFTLATMMMRPMVLFQEELSKKPTFSEERYGCVDKVYIVCDQDDAIKEDFQRWMIQNNPVKEVMVIDGADHMPMLCKSKELCKYLAIIVDKYVT